MLRAHSHDRDVVISKAVVELRTTRLVSSGKFSRAPAHNQNVHKERCMPRGANVHPSAYALPRELTTSPSSFSGKMHARSFLPWTNSPSLFTVGVSIGEGLDPGGVEDEDTYDDDFNVNISNTVYLIVSKYP